MLPMKTGLPARALRLVTYLTPEEVQQLSGGCRGRQRDRDTLLILVLFQTGLRISEALSLAVGHLSRQPGALEVLGKGGKARLVACPAPLVHRLKAFAFDRGLGPGDRLFPGGAQKGLAGDRRRGRPRRPGETGLPAPLPPLRGHRAPAADRQPPGPAAAPGPCQPLDDHALPLHHHGRGGPAHQPGGPVRGLRRPPPQPPGARPLTPGPAGDHGCPAVRLRPFRQYFYIDSEHHLIDNGIITSARDTFNAVEVAYVDEATKAFPTGQGAPDPYAFYTSQVMPAKCNGSLRDDYCRWYTTRERNCEGNVWAQRYGMAHLFHCLKDLYQGEIVITGEPAMKPYDQVFLHDSYNDMHGVFEVEQVTHIFSSETGFVTCIVPDLVVQCNELASMALTDALGAYFAGAWFGHQKDAINSGKVNSVELADTMAWGIGRPFPQTFR